MTPKIGIAGINGRMGKRLCEEVLAANVILAGGIGRPGAAAADFPDIQSLASNCDILIDFSHADAVCAHASALAAAGTGWVLGTTGLSVADGDAVRDAALHIPIVAAPNFSPGVVMILAIAEQLGAALPAADYDAEILEMHHRQKVDAPSGTALALGRAVAAGRGVALEDVRAAFREGHAAPRRDGDIGFASLRGGQIVGSHNLIFTSGTEQIGLTHHAFDRRVFAAGAVRAALWLHGRPPGLYSMQDVLGLTSPPVSAIRSA